MPQRATSRGLLFAGVALVLVACPLIAVPVLRDRGDIIQARLASNDALHGVVAAMGALRDAMDNLRDASSAQRTYLLTGTPADRAYFAARLEAARDAVGRLGLAAPPELDWPSFSALTSQLLRQLDDGAALQAAGEHDAAVAASRIASNRGLMADTVAAAGAATAGLRRRYDDVLARIVTAGDANERLARALFAIAGVSFALGCIALAAYQRRRIAAERALREGRDAAVAASLLKTRFVATASHDLRQPLHAISMFVGVLRRRSQDPAVREVVENVATAVASMQRMFAALLDVARLDAGAISVVPRQIRLQEVFDALKVEFAATAAAKGVSLQIPPTRLAVESDPALLETILRNLLGNALKFCDQGAVGIITRRHGGAVEVTVFDTGIGIAPEDQPRIFEQFERVAAPGGAREGLGLGLSIVRRMAELLDIAVTVNSQPGLGSRFSLSLPFTAADAAPAPAATPMAELNGVRILVLDDHPEARRAIGMAVLALGGTPSEAGTCEAALDLATSGPDPPHAAIVDHDLGNGRTGPGFLDMHLARTGRALPAVLVTGSTDAATLARLRESGRPWLIKPVDLDTLGPVLAQLAAGAPAR